MTLGELERALYEKFPRENQAPWDNTGLLVGDPARPVGRLLVSLDITEEVVDEAVRLHAGAILSHHPVIYRPLHAVSPRENRVVWLLLQNGLGAVCMHTNLDTSPGGVGDSLADALGLREVERVMPDEENPRALFGRVGSVEECTPEAFCERVKQALETPVLRAVCAPRPVRRVAVLGGSGKAYLAEAAALADAFVTADCGYHDFQTAASLGLTLIDAGHFPTENVVLPALMRAAKAAFPDVDVLRSAHGDVIQFL